ncbi:hypothetical protein [Trujillonella endophytica]|uniref:Beta-lactamase enzyme family protein n=1 Tax=Trujillonella endophytica TaxID=673521 RepID=A0A1H8PUQ5_9ACTN|nr:hypothetical protein [Trujillella endophytica]SEO45501.1 hypothetical protein SAMN05660991_00385 [Trujillella endophytica]
MRRRAAPPGRAPHRRTLRRLAILVVVGGTTLVPVLPCAAAPPGTAAPPASAVPDGSPPAATPAPPPPALADAAQAAGGAITAVVLDPAGRVLTAADADRPLPTASLVKVLVVEELLTREARGTVVLTAADRSWMAAALTTSDDAAMSALWVRHDGAALVAAAVVRHRLTGTAPPRLPGQWGTAPTTARDVAAVLSAVERGTRPADAVLRGWLRAVTPTAADGFDQAFGLLGAGGAVAAKQGWMCCVGGRRHLHSAGVLPDGRIVVVLGEFPRTTPWSAARPALDGAAAALVAATAPSEVAAR